MMVAMSVAPRSRVREVSVSSGTSAPPAVSAGRSVSSSHRCSSAGSRSRASEIIDANPSVSAMTARASELEMIHSACSAEEVS